jgi:hypothetical protein
VVPIVGCIDEISKIDKHLQEFLAQIKRTNEVAEVIIQKQGKLVLKTTFK